MKKLNQLSTIKRFSTEFKGLSELSALLRACLQESWQPHCEIVRVDANQKKIVLSTSEQSLLMPLRFMQENLLQQLRKKTKSLSGIEKIECIYTPFYQATKKEKKLPRVSSTSASSFEAAAENCPDNLKKALLKLSKTLNERTRL